MSSSLKVVFIGEPGAGKTTCIGAISDVDPVVTDVGCTDELLASKATTTVAMDYGEITLEDRRRMVLYGLPGQARFSFMYDAIGDGVLGVVILVDASDDDVDRRFRATLATYAGRLHEQPCIVALNKGGDQAQALFPLCRNVLQEHGLVAPVVAIDARSRTDIGRLFQLLLLLGRHNQPTSDPLP